MAGYLIHLENDCLVSVPYAELHVQDSQQARIVFYENEACEYTWLDIDITVVSPAKETAGIHSSCFVIWDHQFSARSTVETKLWLRAISNLKEKLKNYVPCLSSEELMNYRSAIKEHLSNITEVLRENVHMDALMHRVPRSHFAPEPVKVVVYDDERSQKGHTGKTDASSFAGFGVAETACSTFDGGTDSIDLGLSMSSQAMSMSSQAMSMSPHATLGLHSIVEPTPEERAAAYNKVMV